MEENNDYAWFEDEKELDEITVKALEEHCSTAFALRGEIKQEQKAVDYKKEKLSKMHMKLIAYLDKFEKTSYDSAIGKITQSSKDYYSQPKGEGKEAFIKYLKETNQFMELVTFNANTLSSWAKKEIEGRREEGDEVFLIPGLTDAYTKRTLKMSKK